MSANIDPAARAAAKKKAADRIAKNKKNGQNNKVGDLDMINYLFNGGSSNQQGNNDKLDSSRSGRKHAQKKNANGKPFELPKWMRDAADPLGLGLVPSDEKLRETMKIPGQVGDDGDAIPDILDITPTTKEEVRQQLRALYGEEPTKEAVDNQYRDLQ